MTRGFPPLPLGAPPLCSCVSSHPASWVLGSGGCRQEHILSLPSTAFSGIRGRPTMGPHTLNHILPVFLLYCWKPFHVFSHLMLQTASRYRWRRDCYSHGKIETQRNSPGSHGMDTPSLSGSVHLWDPLKVQRCCGGSYVNPHIKALNDKKMKFILNFNPPPNFWVESKYLIRACSIWCEPHRLSSFHKALKKQRILWLTKGFSPSLFYLRGRWREILLCFKDLIFDVKE